MIRRISIFLLLVVGSVFVLNGLQPDGRVQAQVATRQACEALPDARWEDGECVMPGMDLNEILGVFLNLFSIIVGIVAVVMIIYSGFKYITAAGDASNLTSAKNTLLYAIVGLVIAALAQFIVQFVLSNVTGGSSN